ncbi:MAG TPA: hypothetical protein VG936_12830 [Lacunisphaera sp.]|nr:hypothetical protein [Lacunisphaera sp.]
MPRPPTSPALRIFLLAVLICSGFALFTDHRWEDFYITYRTSKNLVEGHGLVFQVGEHVHTFTSPLGVLLPAFALELAGGVSDEAALWIFRVWCTCALGGAAVLLWRAAGAWGWSSFGRWFLALLPLFESKCVDFSINGMETAFMLLGLAWMLDILSRPSPNAAVKLGLVWAGLMWTRPDGFIFGGALALAWLAFRPTPEPAGTRRQLLLIYLRALPIAALLYLPWFLWAWHYYGSPVPNTIVAKGLSSALPGLRDWAAILLRQSLMFAWNGRLREVFLPSYAWFGGWPAPLVWWMQVAAALAIIAWMLPRINPVGRAASLAFFVGSLYGSIAPKFPWYYPCHAIAAMVALASLAEQLGGFLVRRGGRAAYVRLPMVAHLGVSVAILLMAAWQLRNQQAIIEGQRASIGRWLKAHRTTPDDTVFLEPLGYIGFNSQLRMLDYPGLSAPAVIAARRAVGNNWDALIRRLGPDWLVLRRFEAIDLFKAAPDLLDRYDFLAGFDSSDRVTAVRWLPGRIYLQFDETFDVFHRKATAPTAIHLPGS